MDKEYVEKSKVIMYVEDYAGDNERGILLRRLKEEPAANVKPIVYGEWILDKYGYYHCSECRCEINEEGAITPYCPRCGACMEPDGELEDEDEPI